MRWLSPLWRRPRAGSEPLESLGTRRFVAIDLETTGLDPRRDGLVSLAAVRFIGGEPAPALVTLVNPGRPIPGASTVIHGIDDAMVAQACDEASAVRQLDAACAAEVVVGHRLDFDLTVLTRVRRGAATPAPHATLCTQRLAAALHPAWPDVSLDAVCAALGVPIADRHTAHGDAVTAGRLLLRLVPLLRGRGIRTLGEAVWLQETVPPHP